MKTRQWRLHRRIRWMIVPVVAILAAAWGGAALAHDGARGEIGSRVAAILEMDEQTVLDAFREAAAQRAEEALQGRLAKLVESGRLTQAQADEFLAWYGERPEEVPGFGFGKHRFPGARSDINARVAELLGVDEESISAAISQAAQEVRNQRVQERLDRAVEDESLTQDQADAILERLESGPSNGQPGRKWEDRGRQRVGRGL